LYSLVAETFFGRRRAIGCRLRPLSEKHVSTCIHAGLTWANVLIEHYARAFLRSADRLPTYAACFLRRSEGNFVSGFGLAVEHVTKTGDWIYDRDQLRRRGLSRSTKQVETRLATSAAFAVPAHTGVVAGMNAIAVGKRLRVLGGKRSAERNALRRLNVGIIGAHCDYALPASDAESHAADSGRLGNGG